MRATFRPLPTWPYAPRRQATVPFRAGWDETLDKLEQEIATKRGVRWVIPESILPRLIAGRRRFTEDAEHRRQVRMYDRLQARGTLRAMQRARPRLRKAS